jgi:ribose transport system substrate-binding protein
MRRSIAIIAGLLLVFAAGAFAAGQGEKSKGPLPLPPELQKVKDAGGQYAVFDALRQAADAGQSYPGLPGKGRTLGFANIYGTLPFCVAVQKSIGDQAKLAGFDANSLYIVDNQYNSTLGLKNADIILAKHPDVFVEYQADSKVNSVVAQKYGAAGIPLVAIDVPVPTAPFVGINNPKVAIDDGETLAGLIRQKWGGWDAVDLVVILQNPVGGEVTMQRSEGVETTLIKEFGDKAKDKIVKLDGGTGETDQAKQAMANVLAAHPNAKKIAFTSLNDETAAGGVAALQDAGRWNKNDVINVTLGCDDLGQSMLRSSQADASVAFLPEHYGNFVVPAAIARMYGQPVPDNVFVKTVVVTLANLDQYYPPKK